MTNDQIAALRVGTFIKVAPSTPKYQAWVGQIVSFVRIGENYIGIREIDSHVVMHYDVRDARLSLVEVADA